jgi:hypothetical protein
VVRRTIDRLGSHGLVGAIGGSGLLAAMGLTRVVHDWDVATDAARSSVETALVEAGLSSRDGPGEEAQFASAARFVVDAGTHEVDVIVGFALWDHGRRIELPTRVTGSWRGLPLADPSVWEQADRILGRNAKADLLAAWRERADPRQ